MARPDPYVPRNPNDLILAGDWNELQTRAREEIQGHDHSGGAMGTPIGRAGIQDKAIDGNKIDPSSTVTVAALTVSTTFQIGTRALLADVDSLLNRTTTLEGRATALENGKVNRSGDTINGVLRVNNLSVQSNQATPPAQIALGTNLSNTKIALHDNPGDLYGLGIQGSQFRLHVGNTGARFSFLGSAAGAEIMTIQGSGAVGIGEPNPQRSLHIREPGPGGDWGTALYGRDPSYRPGVVILGSYPEIQLFSRAQNASHGSVLRLGGYNSDLQTFKSWSLGTPGQNARFLDIGFNSSGDQNPHNGLRNQNGRTVLTLLENGNVGIVNLEPGERLSIGGDKSGLELGAGVADKQPDAGKLAYARWSNALDIVGAGGPGIDQRRVKIWAEGGTQFTGDVWLNDHNLWIRSEMYQGLGWYGGSKQFAGTAPDGPILFGWSGGGLGTSAGGQKLALTWNSDGNIGILENISFGTSTRQMLNLWGQYFGIGIQSWTAYFRTAKNFAWYKGGQHNDNELSPGGGIVQMAINDGNVGIGTASPQATLHIRSSSTAGIRIDDQSIAERSFNIYFENGNGTIVFYHQSGAGQFMRQDGVWQRNSDISLKENVTELSSLLDKVVQLRPVSFDWKNIGLPGIGFIAQEVEPVFPEIVSEHAGQDGNPVKGLSYSTLSVLAIGAIKEMKRRYDARIDELEKQLRALTSRA
jgi:hypothetical protein